MRAIQSIIFSTLFVLLFLFLFSKAISSPSYSDTQEITDSLLVELQKTKTPNKQVQLLSELAFLTQPHNINLCLKYTEQMLEIVDQTKILEHTGVYYTNAAIIFLQCDIYDKALEFFLKALNIMEKEKNAVNILSIKNNIGGVYFRLNKPESALTYFMEALHKTEELIHEGDSSQQKNLHAFYNNIGLCYDRLEQPDKAIQYIEQAITLCDTLNYEYLGQYYNNIALYYHNKGEKNKALDCIRKSIGYNRKIDNEMGLGKNYLKLAQLFYKDNDTKESRKYAEKAIAIGRNINSKFLLQYAYQLYIDLCEQEHDYQEANVYLKKLFDLRDELFNDTIASKITALKLQYDFDKRAIETQIKNQNKELRYQLTLVIILSLLGGTARLYFLAYSRNKRIRLEKQSLEKDLEFKNKELTSNVMFLLRNSDLIHSIISRLYHLKSDLKGQQATEIKNIVIELQSVMKNDLWDEFKVHFNQVYLDFYKKLQEYYPDLSPADLKLCAFLRLNMSSKEIAALCGVTVKSVEVMRSRLRKKLNIANTDVNLNTFLSEF